MWRNATMILVTGAVVATGCSGEDLAEKVIEDRIEAESGEDVDIDFDDGDFSIQTEDGEFSVDIDEDDGNISISGVGEDGDFSIQSEDGETVIESEDGSAVMSSSGDLPDGFPGAVPMPDDLTIQLSQAIDTQDGTVFSISGEISGSPSEVTDDYIGRLEAAGFSQMQLTTTPDAGFFVYQNDEYDVGGSVAAGGDDGTSFISINVSPLPAG